MRTSITAAICRCWSRTGSTAPSTPAPATADLCRPMLADAASIQERDAAFLNKRLPAAEIHATLPTLPAINGGAAVHGAGRRGNRRAVPRRSSAHAHPGWSRSRLPIVRGRAHAGIHMHAAGFGIGRQESPPRFHRRSRAPGAAYHSRSRDVAPGGLFDHGEHLRRSRA